MEGIRKIKYVRPKPTEKQNSNLVCDRKMKTKAKSLYGSHGTAGASVERCQRSNHRRRLDDGGYGGPLPLWTAPWDGAAWFFHRSLRSIVVAIKRTIVVSTSLLSKTYKNKWMNLIFFLQMKLNRVRSGINRGQNLSIRRSLYWRNNINKIILYFNNKNSAKIN